MGLRAKQQKLHLGFDLLIQSTIITTESSHHQARYHGKILEITRVAIDRALPATVLRMCGQNMEARFSGFSTRNWGVASSLVQWQAVGGERAASKQTKVWEDQR